MLAAVAASSCRRKRRSVWPARTQPGCAFVRIRSGNVQSHREWMTRSYALVFAAVTLRLYAPFLEGAFGEYNGYAIVAWACWVPNLAVAEWLVRSKLRRSPEAPSAGRVE